MAFRNSEGTRVDPVPFMVTTLLLALIFLSWGPGYLLAFGVSLEAAIATSALVTAVCGAGAYHRLVWTARPDRLSVLSPSERLKQLAYLALAGALIIVLLAIPLYART